MGAFFQSGWPFSKVRAFFQSGGPFSKVGAFFQSGGTFSLIHFFHMVGLFFLHMKNFNLCLKDLLFEHMVGLIFLLDGPAILTQGRPYIFT